MLEKGDFIRELITNERIRAQQVRLIDETGNPLGIVDSRQALQTAYDRGLDLILISPNSQPPVCRIGDRGKYKYELSKREKEARRGQRGGGLKEIKLSVLIARHDFEVRANKAKELLEKNYKIKVSIFFRGRQMAHQDLGRKVMEQMIEAVNKKGKVEVPPRIDGKIMSMILVPAK